jgi:G3E family GTPase
MRGLCGAMRRLQDVVVEIPSVDGEAQLVWLARALKEISQAGRFERVLIEVAGTTNPARLAEHFLPGGALAEHAEVEQVICVVDALELVRTGKAARTPYSLWDFQQEQIAGATLAVLNKCDLVHAQDLDFCRKLFAEVHPEVPYAETAYCEVGPEIWAKAAGVDALQAALTRKPAYLREREAEASPALSSALYRVHRPFHPGRFWAWFNAEHEGLLRVKGLLWLASRSLLVGGVSRTRWQNSCGAAGIWWAALPREEWPQEPTALARMQETWREPYGDRRQEMVLLGDGEELKKLARQLNGCLLNDEEFARGPREWLALPDLFPDWDVGEEG